MTWQVGKYPVFYHFPPALTSRRCSRVWTTPMSFWIARGFDSQEVLKLTWDQTFSRRDSVSDSQEVEETFLGTKLSLAVDGFRSSLTGTFGLGSEN